MRACVCVRAQKVPLLQVLTSVSIIHSSDLPFVLTRTPVDTEQRQTARLAQRHHSTTRDRVRSDGSFLTVLILPKCAVRQKAMSSLCVYTSGCGVSKL